MRISGHIYALSGKLWGRLSEGIWKSCSQALAHCVERCLLQNDGAMRDAIDKTGLKEHLAPTRANALNLMANQMKKYALLLSAT